MRMYDELTPWYHLLDPRADHEDEAAAYAGALVEALGASGGTLLELGCGAGNNAWWMKTSFRCTLSDPSPQMLALSQAQNPECEHVHGDMRTLRLDRRFDAVFIHDAIVYMTTEADLEAAMRTVWHHLRPGGVAALAPDTFTETFVDSADLYEADENGQSMRCMEWMWDPDPTDSTYRVDYCFLIREGGSVRAVHDHHIEGHFAEATWRALLTRVGFEIATGRRPVDDGIGYTETFFVIRRPHEAGA